MPRIISFGDTGPIDPKDLKENPIKSLWEAFQGLDRFTKLFLITGILLVVGTPIIVGTVLNLRTHAGGGGIASVGINPGSVNLTVGKIQPLSTIAYSYAGVPFFSGVSYEWSMSSDNSIATFSKTVSDITELTALKAGCGQLTVIARDGFTTVTKSIPVVVSDISGVLPECASIPSGGSSFNWHIGNSVAKASGVYILINNKKFFLNMGIPVFSGYSTYGGGIKYQAILNVDWYESGIKMKGSMLIDYSKDGSWAITGIKTTDGAGGDNWISYGPLDQNGKSIQGGSNYTANNIDLISTSGRIHINSLTLTNFSSLLANIAPLISPTPTPGSHPIGIGSPDVDLNAGNFYIYIKGSKFYGTKPMDVHNNISKPYPSATTLETTWHENGVEMRMFMYFRVSKTNPSKWEMYDLRTYNGNSQGNWIYYDLVGANGKQISAVLGQPYISSNITFKSKPGNVTASIIFGDLKLFPFLNYHPTPTPTLPPPPQPKIKSFVPVADTFVRSDQPITNFGKNTNLRVKGTPKIITYLKFDLTALKNKRIQKAVLRVKVSDLPDAASSASENVQIVPSLIWQEDKLTYNTRPSLGAVLNSFKGNKRATYFDIDITNSSFINSFNVSKGLISLGIANSTLVGIANSTLDGVVLNSKESTLGKPTLIIYYQDPEIIIN